MRTMLRNARKLYYSIPTGTERITDEWGNETLEVETIYSEPKLIYANYSAAVGEEAIAVFGSLSDYSRTIVFSGDCPLVEGAKLWIGIEPTESANYKVRRVADSPNGYLVAVSEV